MLSTIIHSENALSRQLKNSEDGNITASLTILPPSAARERHEKTKANLRKEFIKQRETDSFQRDTKSEDQQKVCDYLLHSSPFLTSPLPQIKADMDRAEREFLKSQERRRQAKQEAAQNYQRLLDQQLIERKEKSLATLKGMATLIPLFPPSHPLCSLFCCRDNESKRKGDECRFIPKIWLTSQLDLPTFLFLLLLSMLLNNS